ncbi:hypothetical protein MMC30_003943 [Trapelia coarctata]|nr:hypothetical protein [Trapelia coarctata]
MNSPFLSLSLSLLLFLLPTLALPPWIPPFASTELHPKPPLQIGPPSPRPNPTDLDALDCFDDDVPAPLLTDCATAITLIPSGALTVDPRYARAYHTVDLVLPDTRRKFLLPAAFLAGTCLVTVDASAPFSPTSPPPPMKAASEMYFKVWPNARTQAQRIVEGCLGGAEQHPAGSVEARSVLEGGYVLEFFVTVIKAPRGFPGDGWIARLDRGVEEKRGVLFNVYEVGGRAEGKGTMGVWVGPS